MLLASVMLSLIAFVVSASTLVSTSVLALRSGSVEPASPITVTNNTSTSTTTGRKNSCVSLTTCGNCTRTYTCHWCKQSNSCHDRGSFYGCRWGDTCSEDDKKNKKENSTCASQTTCSDCALSSRFCHWCEQDNACHAIGSRWGCAVGVDCYSNDRCRRTESESLPVPSTPVTYVLAILNRVPSVGLIVILVFGVISLFCLCCCHHFTFNVKGAFDDLATITVAASVASISAVGGDTDGHFYNRLESLPEEVIVEVEGANDFDNSNNNNKSNNKGDSVTIEQSLPRIPERSDEEQANDSSQTTTINANNHGQQQQQRTGFEELNEDRDILYYSVDDQRIRLRNQEQENGPLLHPNFNGSITGTEEPYHIKCLYRLCSIIYYLSVIVVVSVVGLCLFMYPQLPVYNVCNDEVAWTGIMKDIVAFKLDASFEILASLSNPNRIAAVMDRGKGSFSFEGENFGTFEIPPVTGDAMAITDFMIVVNVSPSNRQQVVQLAEAYYTGKLIINAEFEGSISVPSLFDYTRNIQVKDIIVDINADSDRSLCHCKAWGDEKNHANTVTTKDQSIPLFMLDIL